MKNNKFIQKTLALALGLLVSVSSLAFAQAPETEETATAADSVYVWGSVTDLDENRLTLKNDLETGLAEITLIIAEDTLILDAVSGLPVAPTEIQENDFLYAYTSAVMTKSLPPQSVAEVIICNTPADMAAPTYATIDKVEVKEDGSIVLVTNRDVNLTVTDETVLTPYLTKNIVLKEMLQAGDRILAWYDVVATSFPAQASPSKIMLLPARADNTAGEPESAEADLGSISTDGLGLEINGQLLPLNRNEALFEKEGVQMVPLRKSLEALGYEVSWDEQARSITVTGGHLQEAILFRANSSEAQQNGTSVTLRQPITLSFGYSFIALEDIKSLSLAQ